MLNEACWREEAEGVIQELADYVKLVAVSDIKSSRFEIFLNLVTLEDLAYTVKLCERGFTVVGRAINTMDSQG